MHIPSVHGVIDRRLLLNYRVSPERITPLLPAPFRPRLVNGFAMAGICLIRLREIRPALIPGFMGLSSENAAHRIAVEWDMDGRTLSGVYIPRRDTSSRLVSLVGGRLFSGAHYYASFDVRENAGAYRLHMKTDVDGTELSVLCHETSNFDSTSVFKNLDRASEFYASGAIGYSPGLGFKKFEGLELRTDSWNVTPLLVAEVHSSFFSDSNLFPEGSVQFDCGLLMRNIPHSWHSQKAIRNESLAKSRLTSPANAS